MTKDILCGFGVDVDAVAGWLGSYGGEDSPDDISRGMFSGEVGAPRLLKLFDRLGIKTTWFIPGHSIETFPKQMKAVAEAGHEIGIHGYSHENPISMTPAQEEAVLDKCIELVERLSGRRPTGYVAPWWEFSNVTNELLLKKGIKYDHSLMHDDFHPYYVRVGDSWTKKTLVRAILKELGVREPKGTVADLTEQAIIRLAEPNHPPLFIDEADKLVDKGMIELVREIQEGAQIPIVLIGEELLPQKLQKVERVHNRVLEWVPAEKCDVEDTRVPFLGVGGGLEAVGHGGLSRSG